MMKHYVRLACFVGGALFGSVGVKLLSSKDAKKAYTHITAAVHSAADAMRAGRQRRGDLAHQQRSPALRQPVHAALFPAVLERAGDRRGQHLLPGGRGGLSGLAQAAGRVSGGIVLISFQALPDSSVSP